MLKGCSRKKHRASWRQQGWVEHILVTCCTCIATQRTTYATCSLCAWCVKETWRSWHVTVHNLRFPKSSWTIFPRLFPSKFSFLLKDSPTARNRSQCPFSSIRILCSYQSQQLSHAVLVGAGNLTAMRVQIPALMPRHLRARLEYLLTTDTSISILVFVKFRSV
jgi:hypothetical protein